MIVKIFTFDLLIQLKQRFESTFSVKAKFLTELLSFYKFFYKKSMSANQTIKPLFDYVLVKAVVQDEVTAAGIVLPDTAKEKPQIAEVIAVGPGAVNEDGKIIPMVVSVGQKVMYKKWGGNEVKLGYQEYMLIEQKDIMAIVE